jgi:hypothetical protein
MSFVEVAGALDRVLPDDKVVQDARLLLRKYADGETVDIRLGRRKVSIPVESSLEIVTKAFFKEYFEGVGFGVYKVLIAAGGFEQNPLGIHKARYCFMTLYYDDGGNVITEDFHLDFR